MWRPVTEEELLLYVDGRLPRSRESAVAIHLEANPRDAERIEDYRRQNELLRELAVAIECELPDAGEARLRRLCDLHVARARRRRGVVAAVLVVVSMLGLAGIETARTSNGAPMVAASGPTHLANSAGIHPVAALARER